jgi:hypothetical protein
MMGIQMAAPSTNKPIMKTTLDIDDELLVKAKALSARERKSLTSLIEEGLGRAELTVLKPL